jgi:hypothetical protein
MDAKDQGSFEVNKQYQEAIKIVINLVTASLVLPIVFLKNIVGTDAATHPDTIRTLLRPYAYLSWGFLALSLGFCVAFYLYSTKYTKALFELYGDYKQPTEHQKDQHMKKQMELTRDTMAWGVAITTLFGLFFLAIFLWIAIVQPPDARIHDQGSPSKCAISFEVSGLEC